jgi:hypothetical protein
VQKAEVHLVSEVPLELSAGDEKAIRITGDGFWLYGAVP